MTNASNILPERCKLLRPSKQLQRLINEVSTKIICLAIGGQLLVSPSASEGCAETVETKWGRIRCYLRVTVGTHTDSNSSTMPRDCGAVSGSARRRRRAKYS